MHIDYRCYIKFRNSEVWKKQMAELKVKGTDGGEYSFLDITQIFTDPSMMIEMPTNPMGDIFDTLNSNENLAFAFIHDYRKSPEYFKGLTTYIMDMIVSNAENEAIVIADYTDFDNDYMGDHIFYYFGGGKEGVKEFVIPGYEGLERHDIEINAVEELFGDEYSKLSDEQKKAVEEYACPVGNLMDSTQFMDMSMLADMAGELSGNRIIGVHFFIHDEINQALLSVGDEDGVINIPFEPGYSFSADVIEQPIHYKVAVDEEKISLELFIRREIGIFEGDPNVTYTVYKDGRTPEVGGSGGIGGGEPDQIGRLFLKAACALRGVLETQNLLTEFDAMDPESEGVLVSYKDDEIEFKKVSGKKRPLMACMTLFGGVEMKRPYMDEITDAWALDMMSFEDRVEMAENGDMDSMKKLALSYLNGDDEVDIDPEKAAYWMEKAASEGDEEAQFNMGLFYAKGYGVKRDFSKMADWMKKAAGNGDEDAEGFLERFGNMRDNMKKAEKGNAKAQAEVAAGFMKLGPIMDQAGPDEDYKESVKWATKAAAQNDGFGIWTLALAYQHGRGVKPDIKKAIELYQKGANLGDPSCKHNLGAQYMSGEYLKKDAHKGFALVKEAAEQGNGQAMRDLGRCYQFAQGTPGNMLTAIKWYEKALEVIDDPELERKVEAFKSLADVDPQFGEDYPEDEDFASDGAEDDDAYEAFATGLSAEEEPEPLTDEELKKVIYDACKSRGLSIDELHQIKELSELTTAKITVLSNDLVREGKMQRVIWDRKAHFCRNK